MRHFKAVHLYIAGTILMVLATITGRIIQEDLARLGAQGFLESGNPINAKPILFVGLAILSIVIIMFIHKVLGVSHSPAYFGAGGVSIMVLIAISIWYWGKYRAQLSPVSRKAVDLQAVGYLFFALAAWNLCGVGGPPGFALYPEKMLVLEPKFFAVAQLKVVMAFFVIAWVFTALGFKAATKSAQKANSQID